MLDYIERLLARVLTELFPLHFGATGEVLDSHPHVSRLLDHLAYRELDRAMRRGEC